MQHSTERQVSKAPLAQVTLGEPTLLRSTKMTAGPRWFLLVLLTILCALTAPTALAVPEGVGLYIGSFDPPTQAHRQIVLRSALKANLKNVYISVNRGGKHSTKDYRWSLGERISMVRAMLRDASIRVVVLQEPIEGRVALAHHISALHDMPLRGIFGADTLEKDYDIFKVVPGFEYIAVNRPGYTSPELPEGTIVHNLDSPGNISSTEVRKKLSEGVRNIPELHPAVEAFIYRDNPMKAPEKGAESAFNATYAAFQNRTLQQFPDLGIADLPVPAFNPHQTIEGQKEKIIREVLPLADDANRWQVLTGVQQILETYHRTYPLQDPRKAGFLLGSFDPVSKGQIAAINSAIDALGLQVIYFSPLQTSRKPIAHTILDRMAALEIVRDKVNAEVRLVPSRTLLESVEVVDRLNNRHPGNLIAVFGDTVFDANYQRMAKVKDLEFAVFIFGDNAASDIPAGVTRIPADASVHGVYSAIHQLLMERSKALPSSASQ